MKKHYSKKVVDNYKMFKDLNFTGKIGTSSKGSRPLYQEENYDSAEDIFKEMGAKETKLSVQKPIVPKNITWQEYYGRRLRELKQSRPDLIHNQYTQMIADEWKSRNKPQQKQQKLQDSLDMSVKEAAEFIELLRESNLSFIYSDTQFNVSGEAIINAVVKGDNKVTIASTAAVSNNQQSTTQSPVQMKIPILNLEIDSDSDNSLYVKSEDQLIANPLQKFL